MIIGPTNEQRFMAACIRRAFGFGDTPPADLPIDWEELGDQITKHGLVPLVHAGLAGSDELVPAGVRAQLRAGHAGSAIQHKVYIQPALRLTLQSLDAAGVCPVVLKGAALAALAYMQPAHRTLADLDLLIPAGHLGRACKALVDAGYQATVAPFPAGHHHLAPYRTPDGRIAVELHTNLLPEHNPYHIDVGGLIVRAEVRILALNLVGRVLAPVDSLVHVCAHLAYGHRYDWFPLRTLVDVFAITRNWRDSEWHRLVSTARQTRTSGAVYWPLRLSRLWLDTPIPDYVLVALAPPSRLERIMQPVMESQFVLGGQVPAGWGDAVLYSAIRELSLHTSVSGGHQLSGVWKSVFPAPHQVGHLPKELTNSRLRYGAYLSRPIRLARGALAFGRLLIQARRGGRSANSRAHSKDARNLRSEHLWRTAMPATNATAVDGSASRQHFSDLEQGVVLSVVVPALNEEDGIAVIIERIDAVRPALAAVGVDGLEIIVVDDGSYDRTPEIAASYPNVRVIRHPENRGYGAAIKTGFNAARGQLLAFTDADGTYPPERFPELCRVALVQDADVVVGSRRSGEQSDMPRVRRIGNFIWSNLISVIGNRRVADPASGMRVLRASALPQLYPLPDGLNFTPVMSTRCVHENLKVLEVPIPYKERLGRSKLSVVRDGSRFLKTILWTSLEYNPARVLGLVGVTSLAAAGAIGLAILWLRLQGVTQLGQWGIFSVFAALVLGIAGVSIFTLGSTFNYLVSLFRGRPVRDGLFGRPLFKRPLDRYFGWLGVLSGTFGAAVAATSIAFVVWGDWDIGRLWLWMLGSALLILVGVQLFISWVVMRVLESLSVRQTRIQQDMQHTSSSALELVSGPLVVQAPGAD